MKLIESEFGNALHGPVKRKINNTRKLRVTAQRVSSNSTEVMVKITGFGKGAGHVKAHLNYISRNGKVELENDRGEILSGKDEVKEFFKDWEKDFFDSKRRKNQRDTMHLVLSMPETTDPESVHQATKLFAKETFGKNHEYVFALHTDEPHPHCHVIVKCLGFDGTKLNPRKADLQAWREGFAEKLWDQGVNAEATPRRARGVVKKAEPTVIRHIERGDKSHEPRVSKVKAAKVKEAVQELAAEANGVLVPAKPWEEAIKVRQRQIRRAWLAVADALEQEPTRLTFNQKEQRNERPNYDRISLDRVQTSQRAVAVYQSNLEKSGLQAPTRSIASVRNLSSLDVVHHRRASQMLLQANAPDRLGREGGADPEVRRARTGDSRALGGGKQLDGYQGTAEENRVLAGRIRAFVGAMPGIDTELHQIKKDLVQRFTKRAEKTHEEVRIESRQSTDERT
ncbi:nickase [Verminephrobacter aporrectodeae subsp. tuberculatae]|uniref:relaxase/mobilization nuclease domain-containing protein n=1 Tax=Verminephrobacter aporrectodeae TaxID=1110389 RepID=UPI0002DE3089|nr:relaxase/mobilization nuclease domain-containing protein [Verminephrobacter aporrectodeae]MCW8167036.1 nickase [Verminephrobacter aporrectodeae subsp. tuberculatae]MCW8171191.1 nickase [Verminephrobacter aporrectodeae subsp. tuberculatae]